MTLDEMNATIIEVKDRINLDVLPDIEDNYDICHMMARINERIHPHELDTYDQDDKYFTKKDEDVLAEWRGRNYKLLPLANDQTSKRYEPDKLIEPGKKILVIDEETGRSDYMEVDSSGKLVSCDAHLGGVGGE